MPLVDIEKGSRICAVPKHGMYRLIREKIIPPACVCRIGRLVRLHEEKLREWLEAGGTGLETGGR